MRVVSTVLFVALFSMSAWGQFTNGNIVVLQMGDGVATLSSSSAPVSLKEYTKTGSLVQTIALPSSGSSPRFTVTGNSGSEGHLARSADGKYLTIAGYDTVAGVSSFAVAATKRLIARIDASGNIDLTTGITDGGTSAVRSAVMDGTSNTWMATSGGGIRYEQFGNIGTSIQMSSTPTNTRVVRVYNNQLYISTASGAFLGVCSIGSGTPTTSGQTTTLLPGMPTSGTHSPYGFSVSPDGNTLYVADDGSAANGGGIQKWTLSAGTWSKAYTLLNNGTTAIPSRGLTVDWSGTNPVIYATTSSTPNALIRVTDTGSGSTADTLAASPANTVFRGVDFAPSNGAAFIATTGGPLAFGNVAVGTPSAEQTFTVRGGNLTADITITAPSHFEISTTSGSGFGSSLTLTQAGGAVNTTTIYVRFNPVTYGAASDNISVASTGVTSQNIGVSGTGIQAGFTLSSASMNFGNVILTQNKKDSVYVKNSGTTGLNISAVASDNSLFTVDPTSATLNTGDSVWFRVTFAPTAVGSQSGNIVFTHNASSSPDTVKVTGAGINAPPPSISGITRSTRVPNAGDSVIVSAKVTDLFGLSAVRLLYYVNDVADSVNMALTDTLFTAKIPGNVNQNGYRIEYRIRAISTNGGDSLTAKVAANAYFAGISPMSLDGIKKTDANLLNLYKGYYFRVAGVINGPNYQASNLSQYVQDSVGALNLYKYGAAAQAFSFGDSVIVIGKLDQYRGNSEITPDTVSTDVQKVASGKKVRPIDLTVSQFNANPELYESRLIRLNGLMKRYDTQAWGANTTLVMYGGSQTDTLIMYINSGVDAAAAGEPGYPIKVTAIAVQFTSPGSATIGPYEILPRYQTDFAPALLAPGLSSPQGTTGEPRRATLRWRVCLGALTYRVQVAKDNAFSTLVLDTIVNAPDTTVRLGNPLDAKTAHYWRVAVVDTDGVVSDYSQSATFTTGVGLDGVNDEGALPREFALLQNYPNPFNPATTIGFALPRESHVRIAVYDILGQEVAVLIDGVMRAGYQRVTFNANRFASGVYFYVMRAGDRVFKQKMLLMK